jgi:hypothetical protein
VDLDLRPHRDSATVPMELPGHFLVCEHIEVTIGPSTGPAKKSRRGTVLATGFRCSVFLVVPRAGSNSTDQLRRVVHIELVLRQAVGHNDTAYLGYGKHHTNRQEVLAALSCTKALIKFSFSSRKLMGSEVGHATMP